MTLHSEKPVFVLRHVTHVPLGSLEDVFAEHDVEFVYIDLFDEAPELSLIHI